MAGLIYSWMLYKNRQNRKLLNIRENIARDLHDEIGSNLSSISIFNQVAKESISRKKTMLFLCWIKSVNTRKFHRKQ
ncbi:MAG: hypothetical protein IPM91_06995 [Bacteroidetes bacterium]|nr:hypothetical protein [Bacteroidota bacterium]